MPTPDLTELVVWHPGHPENRHVAVTHLDVSEVHNYLQVTITLVRADRQERTCLQFAWWPGSSMSTERAGTNSITTPCTGVRRFPAPLPLGSFSTWMT